MNYYIADCHFGHQAILRLDHIPFTDIQQMEEAMTTLWNAAVGKNDTVYILGDFCWNKADEWLSILRRLNGQKVLIKGNHDLDQYQTELRNQFMDIKDYKEITDNGRNNAGRKVILKHSPDIFYNHSNDPNCYMLCGHVHRTKDNERLEKWRRELWNDINETEKATHSCHLGQIINVGAMMPYMQYTPRTLDELLRHFPFGKK